MGCGNSNGNCLTRRADVDGNSRRRPTGQRFVSYNLYRTERIGQLIIECGHNESRFESEQAGDQFDNPAAGSDVSKKTFGCGHRHITKFGHNRAGFDAVHINRADAVGIDVADVAGR